MFPPPTTTTKISNDRVEHLVKSILNRREKKLREQQQTFIRRNTDENNKRDNYLIDKFTMKKKSSKENIEKPPKKLVSPKKKTPIQIDDDDDFVSMKKPPVKIPTHSTIPKIDPIRACLESIIIEIENNEAICPICNQILSNFPTIDQRERHVNQCLEESQMKSIETKQQKTLLSYPKFTSSIRKANSTSNLKCQICGTSFAVKRTYLSHLKKCSNENSVQLKHLVNFAAKTTHDLDQSKPTIMKKNIKNRVIRMEVPVNEDDEQQQLAIALSASIKTATEPPNAFDILQAASKKVKTIDLLHTPLWNISIEEKLKISSTRLSALCERVIDIQSSIDSYQFPRSFLHQISQTNFGVVDWWNITTTNPHDDEIPLTQLVRILDENTDDSVI